MRRSQSRGRCSGGVCQKTRLMLPSFIWTVPPWGSSTVMSMRWRRRSTPHDEPEAWRRSCAAPARGAPAPRPPPSAPRAPAPPARHARASTSARAVAVAADAREVAARRVEALGRRPPPSRGSRTSASSRGCCFRFWYWPNDDSTVRRIVAMSLPVAEQERDRAVAQLELARDRLGRAVHDPHHVLEPVAHVEGHHALALGIDAAAARPARHLGQLVVGQRCGSRGRCAWSATGAPRSWPACGCRATWSRWRRPPCRARARRAAR